MILKKPLYVWYEYEKERESKDMIERFVDLLIARQILEKSKKDEYVYVLTLFVERTFTYGFLFAIAFLFHKVLPAIIFMLSFILLRRTTGGYHLQSYLGCLLGTIVIFIVSLEILSPFLQRWSWYGLLFSALAVLIIIVFAPVNHPNLCLTKEEVDLHRRWCLAVLLIQCVIVGVAIVLDCCWQHYIQAGIIDCAVLVIIAKLLRQEVKTDEKDKS